MFSKAKGAYGGLNDYFYYFQIKKNILHFRLTNDTENYI